MTLVGGDIMLIKCKAKSLEPSRSVDRTISLERVAQRPMCKALYTENRDENRSKHFYLTYYILYQKRE